jgi:uncharacterized protein (TIGR00251 family)
VTAVSQSLPYAVEADGLRLAVRLTPRARRVGFEGMGADAEGRPVLLLRVAAPPAEGAANEALIALLARQLGLRKADVTIRSGETARSKLLHLRGEPAPLAARLSAWIAGAG